MSGFVKVIGWALFLLGTVLLALVLIATWTPGNLQIAWFLGPGTYATTWPLLISGALLILFGRIVDLLSDIRTELHALRGEARLERWPAHPAE